MRSRIYAPDMVWQPMSCARHEQATANLERALSRWERTPYESGQRFCQRGADCLGGVFGVIDDVDGRQRAQFPGMPADTALHNRRTAVRAVRELIRRYSPGRKLERSGGAFVVEPGDIVVTGAPGGGPGHVELVGPRRNQLWHALPASGFHQTGWGFLEQQLLFAIYRLDDRERWADDPAA